MLIALLFFDEHVCGVQLTLKGKRQRLMQDTVCWAGSIIQMCLDGKSLGTPVDDVGH